jgi:hypothetical protein
MRVVDHDGVGTGALDALEIAGILERPRNDRGTACVCPTHDCGSDEPVLEGQRRRTRVGQEACDERRRHRAQGTKADPYQGPRSPAAGDPNPVPRERDAGSKIGLQTSGLTQDAGKERAHERAFDEPEAANFRDDLLLGSDRLHVHVRTDVRRLLREEPERIAEHRQLRHNRPEGCEALISHRSPYGPMAHLEEVVRVSDDDLTICELENVELDQIDSGSKPGPERAEGVLRSERSGATVPDSQGQPRATLERDHGLMGR